MLTPALAVKQFSFKPGGMALMLAQVILTLHADQGHGFRVCASPGAICAGHCTAILRQPEGGSGAGLECPPDKLSTSSGAVSWWHQHPAPLPQHPHPPALNPQVRSKHHPHPHPRRCSL